MNSPPRYSLLFYLNGSRAGEIYIGRFSRHHLPPNFTSNFWIWDLANSRINKGMDLIFLTFCLTSYSFFSFETFSSFRYDSSHHRYSLHRIFTSLILHCHANSPTRRITYRRIYQEGFSQYPFQFLQTILHLKNGSNENIIWSFISGPLFASYSFDSFLDSFSCYQNSYY